MRLIQLPAFVLLAGVLFVSLPVFAEPAAAPAPATPAAEASDKPQQPPARVNPRERMWQEADKDSDGAISKEEFLAQAQAMAEQRFARMDTNGDGKITMEERDSHRRMNRDRGSPHGMMMEGGAMPPPPSGHAVPAPAPTPETPAPAPQQ